MNKCLLVIAVVMTFTTACGVAHGAIGLTASVDTYVPSDSLAEPMLGVKLGVTYSKTPITQHSLELGLYYSGSYWTGMEYMDPAGGWIDSAMGTLTYNCRMRPSPKSRLFYGGGIGGYCVVDATALDDLGMPSGVGGLRLGAHVLAGVNILWGINVEAQYAFVPGDIDGANLSGTNFSLGYRF
jgi:hypothetical protein